MLPFVIMLQFKTKNISFRFFEKNYKDILERFQNDNFISDYLNKNKNSKLNVYYFDDKGINNYNVKNINQDEKSWEKFDAYEKNLRKWHETSIKRYF